MVKIELELFDLLKDRIKEAIAHHVELFDSYFVYRVYCWVDEHPDKEEGEFSIRENMLINYEGIFFKKEIVGVDFSYVNSSDDKYDYWVVEIHVRGANCSIKPKFQTEEKARDFYTRLKKYIFSDQGENPARSVATGAE